MIGVLLGVAALALWLPGLGEQGAWSDSELPVLDRCRAALGEPLRGLVRSPWLPDRLRAASYRVITNELGLRLPHAIASAALVGITVAWVRVRGGSLFLAALAGALVASFGAVAVSARTALGNPIGELAGVIAILVGVKAIRVPSLARTAAWSIAAILAGVASISASGLVLGGCIPLVAILAHAYEPGRASGPRTRVLLWSVLAASLAAALVLSLRQGDGYLPLLGAAKDLELVGKPTVRRFAAGLEDFGYAVFPWAGLVLVGATVPNSRPFATWLAVGLAIASGWSLVYGPGALPLAVPAAICGAHAVGRITEVDASSPWRRFAVLVTLLGILIAREDAELQPSRIAVPVGVFVAEHHYPAERLHAPERLREIGSHAALAILLAALLVRPGDRPRLLQRPLARIPGRFREALAVGLVTVAALDGAFVHARVLLPAMGELLSPKTALRRHAAWAARGELPETLAMHRIRDPGLAIYGPSTVVTHGNRRELTEVLAADAPAVALVREADVPALHKAQRERGKPLFVLDDSHAQLRLVANVLPPGAEDHNRISTVLFDAPPVLEHETRVEFDTSVEVIGWQVDGPLVRGRKHTLELVLHVKKPLPGGTKIYTRFLYGRLARINHEAVEIAGDLYPSNLWREGDSLLHRHTFEVPLLEILPGPYDFVIGLRKSERENYEITVPAEREGEFGVRIEDKKRNFARLGQVQVW